MAKTTVETKIKSAKVFDSKFESGAKKAAKSGADDAVKAHAKYAPGSVKDDGWVIELKLNVDLDAKARAVGAFCKWDIYKVEKGVTSLFPSLKQSKAATASVPGVNPDSPTQRHVDDAALAAAENEVAGILKKLP